MSATYNDLPLTNFPDSVDTFKNYTNISAEDGIKVNQYHQALANGDMPAAQAALQSIPNAEQKIVQANDLNKLAQASLAIERFMNGDYETFINAKQAAWENQIDAFVFRGNWSAGTAYNQYNVVLYVVSGVSLLYIATATPPAGTVPTNTNYWRVLTIQGAQGEHGTDFAYMGEWDASVQYNVEDAVSYDNGLWGATQGNINQTPVENSAYWVLLARVNPMSYPVQSTMPTSQSIGDLWFQTID